MDDGFVHRRTGRAEIGELRLRAVAFQNVLRRNRFRRALIGKGALDDGPVDAPRSAFRRRFAFGRWRRRHILVTAIDYRLEGIELRRRLVASSIAPATIAVAAFAEGLAALATPRSAVAIAPFAIAQLAFARLAVATLATPLTLTPLVLARRTIAALAVAVTSITGTTPARATLAALLLLLQLLLCALAGGSRYGLAAWRDCAFGPRAATPTPASARTIAWR